LSSPTEIQELVDRYPSLRLIGNTPLVRLDVFRDGSEC
jgi:hypothetical protein